MFWFLARHGTRNPGIRDMEDMRDILPGVRDKMVDAWREGVGDMEEEDITNLIVWAPEFEIKNAMILTR